MRRARCGGGCSGGSEFPKSGPGRPEAPVPRFIVVTIRISRRIRENETEPARVLRQPAKRPGLFERELERGALVDRHINCPAGVVLAVTGRSAYAKDCVQGQAFGQLVADYFGLTIDASEGRTDLDDDAVGKRRGAHLPPLRGCRGCKQVISAVVPYLCDDQLLRLGMQYQRSCRDQIRRYLQRSQDRPDS